MDPDTPRPSIEYDMLPEAPAIPAIKRPPDTISAVAVPLPPSSPAKSPYMESKSPKHRASPQRTSRSPSTASSRSARQQTPILQPKRSNSNLNASRGVTPSKPQYRRTSSNLNPASPAPVMKPLPQVQAQAQAQTQDSIKDQPITAATVAKQYFQKELDLHSSHESQVAVIVHDACYGHRFSRPRSSKAALSTIVERPERILATLLGAATAYVRLGERHMDGQFGPHPNRQPPLSQSMPFQIRRTARSVPLNHPSVTHVHGGKWMEELQIMCDSAEAKLAMNGKELVRPIGFGKDDNGNPLPKLHEGDLYLCSESLNALQGCLGGVCDAVDMVFGSGPTERAFVCIRPPGHHCSSNFPSGFCWLNNVHVGISYGAMQHGLTHAAIVDFDLHHGDGSQTITWDHNRKAQSLPKNAAAHKRTPIGYYSLHDINSYPCEWGDEDKVRNASLCIENAHGQSIWNVHLEPWKSLEDFWRVYESRYVTLLERARVFLRHHTSRLRASGVSPKGAIFLSAGFDASEWEGAGMQRHNVNVPTEFYARFTADVVRMAQEEDLGVEGRVISVLEGGYSDRALTSGVLSHLCGLVDNQMLPQLPNLHEGLGLTIPKATANGVKDSVTNMDQTRHDANWWNVRNLEALEAVISGNLPSPTTVLKEKGPGHYSSPTHASTAKITEVAKERRSLSAQLEAQLSLDHNFIPAPEVDWATASYELSRLIIPSDRQTLSCRHDELNAEATRARKDRQSILGVQIQPVAEPKQLRDRKARPLPAESAAGKPSSRNNNRRTTIAAISELPDSTLGTGNDVGANTRPRRRSSAASSILSSFQEMKLTDSKDESQPKFSSQTTNIENIRASSVVPEKSAKVVITKKPRASTSKPLAKPRSTPKKPVASTQLLEEQRSSPPTQHMDSQLIRSLSQQRQTSGGTSNPSDGLESITNAMKKVSIKLKMPSAEQQGSEQKTAREDQPKKPRAPRKPAVPRNPKVKPVPKAAVTSPATEQTQPIQSPVSTFIASETQQSAAQPSNIKSEDGKSLAPQYTETNTLLVGNSAASNAVAVANLDGNIDKTEQVIDSYPSTSAVEQSKNLDTPPAYYAADESAEIIDTMALSSSGMTPTLPTSHFEAMSIAPTEYSVQGTENQNRALKKSPAVNSEPIRPFSPNKRTKEDLPKFTSSSPIPFATSSTPSSTKTQPSADNDSIWDVPNTPRN